MQAYGGPQYRRNSTLLLRFAEAMEKGNLALAPNVMVAGSSSGATGGMIEIPMAMLVAEQVDKGKPEGR